MALHETISFLSEQSEKKTRLSTPSTDLVSALQHEATRLLDLVERFYLIEYLIIGSVKLHRLQIEGFAPGVGAFKVEAANLVVGDRVVTLGPRFELEDDTVAVFEMTIGDETPLVAAYLRRDGFGYHWAAPARERGVRSVLTKLLPMRLVALDESAFKAALDRVLLGKQPVVSFDGETFKQHLATFLDTATASEFDLKLAHAARTQLVPRVTETAGVLASNLRASAQTLLARSKPALLPLLSLQRPTPDSEPATELPSGRD